MPTTVQETSAMKIAPGCRLGDWDTPPWGSRMEVTRAWAARVSLWHLSFIENTCEGRHALRRYRGRGREMGVCGCACSLRPKPCLCGLSRAVCFLEFMCAHLI